MVAKTSERFPEPRLFERLAGRCDSRPCQKKVCAAFVFRNGSDPMDLNIHIGRKLRERRKRSGLTLEQLSTALHVTYQQVQKYESGQSKIPITKLYELSLLLHTPIQYFFDGVKNLSLTEDETFVDDLLVAQNSNHHLNILLAESDPVDEFLIRKIFEELDVEIKIFCVHDEIQVTNVLKRYTFPEIFRRPDLILLDIAISKRNGHQLIGELKRDKTLQDIPIIVLTNSVRKDDLVQVYRSGAASLICKSAEESELKRTFSLFVQYWSKAVILPSLAWEAKTN